MGQVLAPFRAQCRTVAAPEMRAELDHRGSSPVTSPAPAAGTGPTREVVTRLAELLWEREGRPAGREAEFRQQALAELNWGTPPSAEERRGQPSRASRFHQADDRTGAQQHADR